MIGKIAVSAAVYAIDKPYDYIIPEHIPAQVGSRVLVPFGKGNRICEGLVLHLQQGEGEDLKTVEQLLDAQPLLDERELRLAAFLRERYFCTFYDAVKAILPAGVWFQEQERYSIAQENWQNGISRQPVARSVMQTLTDFGGEATLEALRKQYEEEPLQQALRYLLRKKWIVCKNSRRRKVQDGTERIVCLNTSWEEALRYAESKRKTAPLQAAVLEMMVTLGKCASKEVCYFTGASTSVLNRLETMGFLRFSQEERLRLSQVEPAKLDGPLELSPEQQRAYEGLCEQFRQEPVSYALLYGVTGSGKTSVYLKLIYDCLEQGRGAILLVPEIALTPQLLSLFAAHFGQNVAVLHSSLRITERYDTWKRIRNGSARVVLGTRSAVFAPVKDLGLIILDEEQEHTYKSENAPRYHAREVAIYRASQAGASVLLGSATPSVETMYRAKTGTYRLYTLTSRYNRRPLPPVEIVDMKQELKEGNPTAISEKLYLALKENIARGRQSILFLNRRGSSPMVVCVDCGHVPMCPGCTVNLTYHHANGRLMCHYCGHSEPLPARCPVCGGHLKQIGIGTQRVQEQLERLFPGTEILRMDADTISAVNTHEKLLRRFQEEKIPILLGTQMVTKGLNFENVTLVGVLDADQSLYIGSYRASENTFSMMTQVIGRAGRGSAEGRAIVQTMTPLNQVITLAARQDYGSFYEQELPLRQLRLCPPYRDLIVLTFHGEQEQPVWNCAGEFAAALQAQLASGFYAGEQVTLLGPAPAQIARVNYHYRCRLTLSCRNTRSLRELLAHMMRQFMKNRKNKGIGLYADVNSNE